MAPAARRRPEGRGDVGQPAGHGRAHGVGAEAKGGEGTKKNRTKGEGERLTGGKAAAAATVAGGRRVDGGGEMERGWGGAGSARGRG